MPLYIVLRFPFFDFLLSLSRFYRRRAPNSEPALQLERGCCGHHASPTESRGRAERGGHVRDLEGTYVQSCCIVLRMLACQWFSCAYENFHSLHS